MTDFFRSGARFILILAGWIFLWWLISWGLNISSDFLPTPGEVVKRLVRIFVVPIGEGTALVHVLASLQRFLLGFALAAAIGIPFGFVMGYFRPVDKLVSPIFEAIRPIPPIAWAPFAILWFGVNVGAQAFVILLSAFPPIVINSYLAIKQVDSRLIDAARVLGAQPLRVLIEVALPSSLPTVFTGLRIGMATGWMALIAAELIAGDGSNKGLGYLILLGQRTLNADLSIAAMILIGVIGALLDLILTRLNRRLQNWSSN
nr:ABC transporter permease [Yoonia sp.]